MTSRTKDLAISTSKIPKLPNVGATIQPSTASLKSGDIRSVYCSTAFIEPVDPFKANLPPIPSISRFQDKSKKIFKCIDERKLKKKRDDAVILLRGKQNKYRTFFKATKIRKQKWLEEDPDLPEYCFQNRLHQEEDEKKEDDQFLTEEDFLGFLRDSVTGATVKSLDPSWIEEIVSSIPEELQQSQPLVLERLIKEMETNFVETMRNAMSIFVVKPPEDYVNPFKILDKLPPFTSAPVWARSFQINRQKIQDNLRLLHPLVWKTFLKVRELLGSKNLLNFDHIRALGTAKPIQLKEIMQAEIRENGDDYATTYIEEVVHMFSNVQSLRKVPPEQLDLLFRCAENVIKCNAMELMIHQTNQIVEAYENYKTQMPIILLDGAMEDNQIYYHPTVEDMVFFLKKVVDEITNTVTNLPDIRQVYRYRGVSNVTTPYKITLHPLYIDEVKNRIAIVVKDWLIQSEEYVKKLHEDFAPILNGEAKKRAEDYIASEFDFYDGIQEVLYYRQFYYQATEIPKNSFMGHIYLSNDDIIHGLQERAETIKHIVLDHLLMIYRKHNQRIVDKFLEIEEKLTQIPKNTFELMEMADYVDQARGVTLLYLKEDMLEGLKMEFALLEVYIFSQTDMQTSHQVQTWHGKFRSAFEDCVYPESFLSELFGKEFVMLEDKRSEFEEKLVIKTEQMQKDLKRLLRRVMEDFARYGDYYEVGKYCEDLKYVNKRIQSLRAGIEWINNEEVLFKFNVTEFPILKEIMDHMEPFSKLWTTTHQWQKSEKIWLDGPYWMDADAIDEETNGYLTTLYKLQEQFKHLIKVLKQAEAEAKHIPLSLIYNEEDMENIPPPFKICNTAIEKITEFRTYLPLIRTMCNPKLEAIHWQMMSDARGIDVSPDTGSSLRKLLKKGYEPYLGVFDDIIGTINRERLLDQYYGSEPEWAGEGEGDDENEEWKGEGMVGDVAAEDDEENEDDVA